MWRRRRRGVGNNLKKCSAGGASREKKERGTFSRTLPNGSTVAQGGLPDRDQLFESAPGETLRPKRGASEELYKFAGLKSAGHGTRRRPEWCGAGRIPAHRTEERTDTDITPPSPYEVWIWIRKTDEPGERINVDAGQGSDTSCGEFPLWRAHRLQPQGINSCGAHVLQLVKFRECLRLYWRVKLWSNSTATSDCEG
eukprot:gene16119-biopygen9768